MYGVPVHSSGEGVSGEGSFSYVVLLYFYSEDWVSDSSMIISLLKLN